MSTNVDPEEAAALMDAFDTSRGQTVREVEQRDFRVPLRLRGSSIAELQRVIETTLPQSEIELSKLLRGRLRLDLVSAGEFNAEQLQDGLDEPLALVRFSAGGHPAWAQWEIESAVEAVEQILGASEPTPATRDLSPLERTVMRTIIEGVCTPLCRRMGLPVEGFKAIGQLKEAGDWREADHFADPHRLGLELRLTTPGGASNLRLYLPIFDAQLTFAARIAGQKLPPKLPPHLSAVELPVCAQLGTIELPLSELLALEVGDVLPLDAHRGERIKVHADGRDFGRAILGSRRGRLALQLTSLTSEPTEPEPPAATIEEQA
ncbi:flagellar motor switch protein FliM [Engelhardtia mirabilis]|uniref:Flagellar motor switch protein FliM n=1 Tax=Engelhardtia mirabilis TaxID=2528011 RepID=A0A518BST4_9BACT|nr:flagellar motor switch protein FliM [Planctomycetes bacterium Pla133]QDV04361.1 flagellar motor switch protein FliM [Planctomycetes bacterium Pla86]